MRQPGIENIVFAWNVVRVSCFGFFCLLYHFCFISVLLGKEREKNQFIDLASKFELGLGRAFLVT